MAYNGLAGMTPEVWSGQLLRRLNDALVYGSVVNRDYESEIRGYGDVVKINEIGPITIQTYNANSTSALEAAVPHLLIPHLDRVAAVLIPSIGVLLTH